MNESQRLADQLKRAYDGEAWHGPSLREALEGVTATMAVAKPIPAAHSIWEITAHIAGWEDVVLRRIDGQALTEPVAGNFPASAGEAEWAALLEQAHATHARLVERIRELSQDGLKGRIDGKDYPVWFMAHGAVGHALYHVGQIVLLKKALS